MAVFELRLSHSGVAVHVAFGSEGQEAFLEGHVTAFARLGGVPARIRYDNARALVARVLRGRDRIETERFIALRTHYGFDSSYCEPGEEGAHEKGGIEGEVGRQRRRFFVPIPKVKSLADLNRAPRGGRPARSRPPHRRPPADRRRDGRGRPGGTAAAARGPLRLRRGSPRSGSTARPGSASASPSTRCPARYAGRQLTARIGGTRIEVADGGTVVASHERSVVRGSQTLVLDHYLEILVAQARRDAGRARHPPGARARACSPRPTSSSGRGRAASSATPAARGPSSRSSCSTGGCRSRRSTPRSRP